MNKFSAAAVMAMGIAAGTGFLPSFSFGGKQSRVYPEDAEKILANRATADDRISWNAAVDERKEMRAYQNRQSFTPRKASHKQG